MSALLTKDEIARRGGRYVLPAPTKPQPTPAHVAAVTSPPAPDGALAAAILILANALRDGQAEQRAEITGMLAQLTRAPRPATDNWKVTITKRDQLGRIAELDFTRNK